MKSGLEPAPAEPTTTRLSRPGGPEDRPGRLARLARVSLLCVGMPAALGGCLDEPPEYRIPEQVPPVIIMSAVLPPLREVYSVPATRDAVTFEVPFRSDDAGEDLLAYFVLDIDHRSPTNPAGDLLGFGVPALADSRPFAEQGIDRVVRFPAWVPPRQSELRPGLASGLHTVTMVLSHQSNFIGRTDQVVDPLGAAEVTWFFDFSAVVE